MRERRQVQRWRTYLSAQIAFNQRQSVVACLVRNRSAVGAWIEIINVVPLPDAFDLTIDRESRRRAVQLRWRTETAIGVAFADLATSDIVPIEIARRIRSLQEDRERLERRIAQLTERA